MFEPLNDRFDKTTPIPRGHDLYYQCLTCSDTMRSVPKDNSSCSCGNVHVDVDAFRVAIRNYAEFRILRKR